MNYIDKLLKIEEATKIGNKTKYDFSGDIGVLELGAVRSELNDLRLVEIVSETI